MGLWANSMHGFWEGNHKEFCTINLIKDKKKEKKTLIPLEYILVSVFKPEAFYELTAAIIYKRPSSLRDLSVFFTSAYKAKSIQSPRTAAAKTQVSEHAQISEKRQSSASVLLTSFWLKFTGTKIFVTGLSASLSSLAWAHAQVKTTP